MVRHVSFSGLLIPNYSACECFSHSAQEQSSLSGNLFVIFWLQLPSQLILHECNVKLNRGQQISGTDLQKIVLTDLQSTTLSCPENI